MGTQESTSQDALRIFSQLEVPGTPLTTSEVAEELDCVRRTAYSRLEELVDNGELETKKVGAKGRVWWRPIDQTHHVREHSETAIEQAQFREFVETVNDYAIFVLDPDGHIQTWNDGARQIKGYDKEEILGEHFSTFYTDADQKDGRPERNLETAQREGRVEDEGWRVREDGETFWANVTITALRDDDGTLQGFIKITRDMTERHEFEEQLRQEKERFEALVREVKDYAIFMLDDEGVVQTWNEGAKQLKGYDEDEIIGEHFSAFYTDADREAGRPESNLAQAAEEGRIEDEGERVRKDGETFWANVTITALYDDSGDVRGYAKVTRDMTERHRYEERLREQRDELDTLNQINAVIRDIDGALVAATSREEIEQAVCDRLAASGTYTAAWVAEYTDDYCDVTPRTGAGVSEEYLTAVCDADGTDTGGTERDVGATALQTRAIQPVQQLHTGSDGEQERKASAGEDHESAIVVPLVYNDVEYGVLTVYADDESAFDQRKTTVLSELGETISHAIAAIRRKEREQTLTALQESTRELIHAETRGEIGDIIVRTLTEDYTLDDALVYCFDTSENVLEPVSSSYESEEHVARMSTLTAGADSPVWTSFMEDNTQLTDTVLPARGTSNRRTLVVPIGDYGVLAVATTTQETFDANTRNLVELVAATGEAAFDRIESQANLRERDELLRTQNQRLQRLNHINTIIRQVDQGVVQATTRDEVEQVVCDRLAASDRFRFAWVGTRNDTDGGIQPQAWSGDGRGYLDSVELVPGDGKDTPEPSVTAAETGETAVVSNVAENLRGSQWRKEAFSREFQSVISVPLIYGDVHYGVLTVYADQPDAFEEMEQTVFAELGETTANAINALDTKQALVSDQAIELEFELRDESTCFLPRLARQMGCAVTFEGAIPLSDERARVFFLVQDAQADAVADVLNRSVAVESSELLATEDTGHLVEAVVSGPTMVLSLLDYRASLRTLTVEGESVQLTVEVPSSEDVRGFIDQFQEKYDSAVFIARRKRDRPVQTRAGLYAELEERLTDRQLEVLKTAHYSGFFASPRQSTGGDVAELLDVSQPTVTEQLRTAQRKLFDLLFDESPGST